MEKLFAIIHEDDNLLIVHKPADLVCHPTKGDEYSSLISRARIYLQRKMSREERKDGDGKNFQPSTCNFQPHLINRLDRETSGLVVIAKNSTAAGELGKIWESRAVQKEYVAIVHGHVVAEQGMIDAPLGKDEASVVAIKDCVRADGTPAQTEFIVERRFSRSNSPGSGNNFSLSAGGEGRGEVSPSAIRHLPFSLLRLLPRSGRKHQIRIHLQHLGHPIVGDKIYGGDSDLYLALVEGRLTAEQRSRLILPTHALHAGRLQFHWRERDWDFCTPPEPLFTDFLKG